MLLHLDITPVWHWTVKAGFGCGGWNHFCQVGNGSTKDQSLPIKVLEEVGVIDAGGKFSLALGAKGTSGRGREWLSERFWGEGGQCQTSNQGVVARCYDDKLWV